MSMTKAELITENERLRKRVTSLERAAKQRTEESKELRAELTEALEQQTATSNILRAISSSPTDLQPVFDTIVESTVRLCDGLFSGLYRFDGELIHQVAQHNYTPEALEVTRSILPAPPSRALAVGRAILARAVVHLPDVELDLEYDQTIARAVGGRSLLCVPMLRDGRPAGALSVARAEPERFSDRQIELLKTFADQAVIAIENVRLFTELQERNRSLTEAHTRVTEALEQQTATSNILRVISQSQTDVQPVFDTIIKNAVRLCDAQEGSVFRFDGQLIHLVASETSDAALLNTLHRVFPRVPGWDSPTARAILTRAVTHVPDIAADPEYTFVGKLEFAPRTILSVPILRDGEPIGAITVARRDVKSFSDTQIVLLETFASQAVIAIENVRLFKELQARNHDLTEALEQQTATGEILRIISTSPTDLGPVLDAVVKNAARFCGAPDAVILDLVSCL